MTRHESIVESVRRNCVQGQHEAGQLQRVVLVARAASQGQPAQQGAALEREDAAARAARKVASDVLRATRATAQGRLGGEFKKTKDAKAMALIRRAMLTEHLPLVAHCKTAQQLWEVITAQFQSKGCTRRFELRQRMMSMVMEWQEHESVMAYIGRGMGLLNEMTAAGIHRDEEGMVMALLNGLPDTYNPMLDVIKTLTSTLEELTIEWITPYLRDRETEILRQVETGTSRGGMVMFSGSSINSAGQQVCYYCQQPGHLKSNCHVFQKQDPKGCDDAEGARSSGALPAVKYKCGALRTEVPDHARS